MTFNLLLPIRVIFDKLLGYTKGTLLLPQFAIAMAYSQSSHKHVTCVASASDICGSRGSRPERRAAKMGRDDGDSAPSERGEISSGERGLLSALFPLL